MAKTQQERHFKSSVRVTERRSKTQHVPVINVASPEKLLETGDWGSGREARRSRLGEMISSIREKDEKYYKMGGSSKKQNTLFSSGSHAPIKDLLNDSFTQVKRRKCILRVDEKKRLRWDTFVIILAIWSVLYVPFSISFRISDDLAIQMVNYFVDSIFVMDIIINFRTTYFDREGDEIY